MKKFICFAVALMMMVSSAFASTKYDLSSLSFEELIGLRNQANAEIEKRQDAERESAAASSYFDKFKSDMGKAPSPTNTPTPTNTPEPISDGEITFSGIPWGIGMSDLHRYLVARGMYFDIADVDAAYSMPVWTYDFRSDWEHNIEGTGYDVFVKPTGVIAGYNVDRMSFYSHFGFDGEEVDYAKDASRYYKVEITMDVEKEHVERGYKDLRTKLKSLYGDFEEATFHDVDYTYTYSAWYGKNDTAACLYQAISDDGEYNWLHLMYGKTNSEETLKDLHAAIVNAIPPADANDLTGL